MQTCCSFNHPQACTNNNGSSALALGYCTMDFSSSFMQKFDFEYSIFALKGNFYWGNGP